MKDLDYQKITINPNAGHRKLLFIYELDWELFYHLEFKCITLIGVSLTCDNVKNNDFYILKEFL